MFFRLCGLAIAAGMLFGVDLASIGAALEGMAEAPGRWLWWFFFGAEALKKKIKTDQESPGVT